jgi:hypothetical protein
MADDAQDVVAEITPDDFDGDKDTSKAAPSPAEEKKPEAVKPEEPVKGDDTPADPKVPEAPDEPKDESVEPEEPQNKVAEERKAQLNTEIRDLVAQRNALKAQVEKANAEVYQPATEDELVQDGMSATDAKVEAIRQRLEVKDFNDRVADAQLTIESESQRVLQDFSVFNPDSKDYDQDLANEAADLLRANLILDPNTGQVIGSNVSPYQLYKTLARASGISTAKGQIKGQQATERMLANADNASAAAPTKKAVDPVIALWESDD